MRIIAIAALAISFVGFVASEAAAGDVATKAGYCKVAAGCTPKMAAGVHTSG